MAGLSASDPAVVAADQHLTTALDGFINALGRVGETVIPLPGGAHRERPPWNGPPGCRPSPRSEPSG
jgi:hypothetical protein